MASSEPILSGAAGRYASALFDLALETNALEAVEADLATLKALIEESADLSAALRSPVISRAELEQALLALAAKAGLGDLARNFMGLVARKGRAFALGDMINGFMALAARHRGEISASAVAAEPMNEAQIARLRSEIEAAVGRSVNLSIDVDPSLLGGLVVKIGSRMIDSSLRTKLNRLNSVLKEA